MDAAAAAFRSAERAAYAKQAKDTQLVEWATEIKVRAERRAGEMLAAMRERGERDAGGRGRIESRPATQLADLGISKDQSSRWQKLAAISEDKFEQAVAAAKEVAGEVTTAALLRLQAGGRLLSQFVPYSFISH